MTHEIDSIQLDNNKMYGLDNVPEIALEIKNENINDITQKMRKLLYRLKRFDCVYEIAEFRRFIHLCYKVIKSPIKPSFYNIRQKVNGLWKTISHSYFLEILSELIYERECEENQILNDIYRNYSTLSNIIEYSSDYPNIKNEDINCLKPYHSIKFVDDWYSNNKKGKLIIGINDADERRVISKKIIEIDDKILEQVEVRLIRNLPYLSIDRSKYELLLFQPLGKKYFSEYFKGYSQIHLILYQNEIKLANDNIKLFKRIMSGENIQTYKYLDKLFEKTGLYSINDDISNVIKKNIVRISNKTTEEPGNYKEHEKGSIESTIEKIISDNSDIYKPLKENIEHEDFIEKISTYDKREEEKIGNKETINLHLLYINTDEERDVSILENRKVIQISKSGIRNVPVKTLKVGDRAIILNPLSRKEFIENIIELFSQDKDIDSDYLNLWSDELKNFMEKKDLKKTDVFKIYNSYAHLVNANEKTYPTILNWLRGDTIAPEGEKDLLAIGKMTGCSELIENYKLIYHDAEKIWALHLRIGRLLNSVVKETMEGYVSGKSNSYEKQIIIDWVQKGLCEVL